jgi:hypothetical protein
MTTCHQARRFVRTTRYPAARLDAQSIERVRGTPTDLQGRLKFRAASLDLELPHISTEPSAATV